MGSDEQRRRSRQRLSTIADRVDDEVEDGGGPDDADSDVHNGLSEREWLPDHWRGSRLATGNIGAIAMVLVGLLIAGAVSLALWDDDSVPGVPPVPMVQAGAISVATTSAETSPGSIPASAPPTELVVSVVGLVHVPGLVRIPVGSRVADALEAAGGVRDGGDTLGLNLAQLLSDGDQIVVGPSDPARAAPSSTTTAGGTGAPSTGASSGAPSQVNLNTADAAELETLPGIGPVTAAAILAWRQAHGPFTDVSQLNNVDGIGPARLEKLRPLVRV